MLSSLTQPINWLFNAITSIYAIRWYWAIIFTLIFAGFAYKVIRHLISTKLSPKPISEKSVKSKYQRYFWHIQTTLLVILTLITLTIIIPSPAIISPQSPLFNPLTIDSQNPLIIEFDRPVSRQLIATLSPKVAGTWNYQSHNYGPLFKNRYVFFPSQNLDPNTEYSVQINRILPLTWTKLASAKRYLFVFLTPPLPKVESTQPKDGQKHFRTDIPIEITFSAPSSKEIDWHYQISPTINYALSYNQDRTKAWLTPSYPLSQNTTYNLKIYRQPVKYNFLTGEVISQKAQQLAFQTGFTTVSPPNINSISPTGDSVLPQQPISISFKQTMDQNSVEKSFTINPTNTGDITWPDQNTFTFIPASPWKFDTTYTLTINQDASTDLGGRLESDSTHQFTTIGPVLTQSISPDDKSINNPVNSQITVIFNQPVEKSSAQSSFSINPSTSGDFSWLDDQLTFSPLSPLAHNQVYSITLNSGIKSIYGQDSIYDKQWTFTTSPQTFSLDIPLYKQTQTYTCYSTASQMVLSYYNINKTELGFLNEIGYDDTQRSYLNNTWGDPNQGIVGTYNGSGDGGYGSHWDPVAKAIGQYRTTQVKRNWNLEELLEQVKLGYPVMVWWVNGVWPAKDVSWNNSSGQKVYTVNGMHVEVVRGWVGDQSNPLYILTNDPWRGNRQYTPETFLSLWKWFNNTAIIVR